MTETTGNFVLEAAGHQTEIYRAALRLTRDPSDAEDLVQETMLQAWRSFGKYEAGTNCRAWLYAILRHKFGQFHRRRAIRAKYFEPTDDEIIAATIAADEPAPQVDRRAIVRALDSLPEHYRDVVLLSDLYEYDYREAADMLGVPIGTVMSRLSRGRRKLRVALRPVAREIGLSATA